MLRTAKNVYQEVADNLRCFLDLVRGATQKLLNAASVLPHVTADGSSECSFAEELYAQKEKARKELEPLVKTLRANLSVVRAEEDSRNRDFHRISNDALRLRMDQPRHSYDRARREQEVRCQKIARQRIEMETILAEAEAALAAASAQQWPRGEPRVPAPGGGLTTAFPPGKSAHSGRPSTGDHERNAGNPKPLDPGLAGLLDAGLIEGPPPSAKRKGQ